MYLWYYLQAEVKKKKAIFIISPLFQGIKLEGFALPTIRFQRTLASCVVMREITIAVVFLYFHICVSVLCTISLT